MTSSVTLQTARAQAQSGADASGEELSADDVDALLELTARLAEQLRASLQGSGFQARPASAEPFGGTAPALDPSRPVFRMTPGVSGLMGAGRPTAPKHTLAAFMAQPNPVAAAEQWVRGLEQTKPPVKGHEAHLRYARLLLNFVRTLTSGATPTDAQKRELETAQAALTRTRGASAVTAPPTTTRPPEATRAAGESTSVTAASTTVPASSAVGTARPPSEPMSADDAKTRGDVKNLRTTVERASADGWLDAASASGLLAQLDRIDGQLATTKTIDPDLQSAVDRTAGNVFRLEFGAPGHVDAEKVLNTLGASIDEGLRQGLLTEKTAAPLRQSLQDLRTSADPNSASWVTDAQNLRRAIVDADRAGAVQTG